MRAKNGHRNTGLCDAAGRMTTGHLLRLAFTLLLILALFWGLHAAVLLRAAKRAWSEESNRRITSLARVIAAEVQVAYGHVLADSTYLWNLARQNGAYRVTLLDREGTVLMDTLNQERIGRPDPLLGTTPSQLASVWDGAQMMSGPHVDTSMRSRPQIRSIFIPLRDPGFRTLSVMRVDLEFPPLEETGPAAVTSLLMKIVGSAVLLVLGFSSVRALLGRNRSRLEREGSPGETAAVIETFHGLVRQLKEKEAELDHLRKRAEERAADIESYNENILQSVTSGVITLNTDRRITTFNHAAERILGLPPYGAIGKTCPEVFGPRSNITALVEQALQRQTTTARQELELNRLDNDRSGPNRIWVGVSTSLLLDRQDQVIGTTLVFSDLTEIKSLQEQVELKRRLTVLGEMSAGIAHEFRNYMGGVMGFAKLLSKRLPASEGGAGGGQEMIAAIMQDLTAMNHLIEQLLSFGRHVELNLEPTEVVSLVRRMVDQILGQITGIRPHLELVSPDDLPPVPMDAVLIRQAVGNLLQNAVEAMPQGGGLQVRVEVLDHGPPGGPRSRWDRKELSIEVRDTGTGIPKDKLDKIFLPFFTTKEKGTGMGLALVHKIVLLHGGRIEVDSREGRGTTFQVLLPLGPGA